MFVIRNLIMQQIKHSCYGVKPYLGGNTRQANRAIMISPFVGMTRTVGRPMSVALTSVASG